MEFVIDLLLPSDWPQVVAIYQQGLATGQATFETVVPTWEEWDATHPPHCRLGARLHDLLIGWAALRS